MDLNPRLALAMVITAAYLVAVRIVLSAKTIRPRTTLASEAITVLALLGFRRPEPHRSRFRNPLVWCLAIPAVLAVTHYGLEKTLAAIWHPGEASSERETIVDLSALITALRRSTGCATCRVFNRLDTTNVMSVKVIMVSPVFTAATIAMRRQPARRTCRLGHRTRSPSSHRISNSGLSGSQVGRAGSREVRRQPSAFGLG
ncbi:hypothetical protein ACFXPS_43820 [Nocardia sp. NPDC059091]|uniref:hypothetical protein n=1 Tax=unclassified Nocardia TaxID=2637762 RepID=UPI0036B4D1BA